MIAVVTIATPVTGRAAQWRDRTPQKLKTTGRALPVVLEVYHKGRSRLLETKLPPNDLIGYLSNTT